MPQEICLCISAPTISRVLLPPTILRFSRSLALSLAISLACIALARLFAPLQARRRALERFSRPNQYSPIAHYRNFAASESSAMPSTSAASKAASEELLTTGPNAGQKLNLSDKKWDRMGLLMDRASCLGGLDADHMPS